MSNRPDPRGMIQLSYILAFVSALILLASYALAWVLRGTDIGTYVGQIIWLALITSAIGTFLAFAARSDLRGQELPPDLARRLRVGLRVNLAALILMLLWTALIIILIITTRG